MPKTSYYDELNSGNVDARLTRFFQEVHDDSLWGAVQNGVFLVHESNNTHKWINRTYDTQNTTVGDIDDEFTEITLVVSVGTDYSVWLELANNGKWAWLADVMLNNQKIVFDTWAHYAGLP